ncbi:PREDICTED: uncharacterized protein C5orf52 homolog [Chrysochloris asiatica]|uniref:Uncharacterized protein C5orf52 homolog n=1 Tax=Chrysochloris asiatica TaxID=185453 RepID=A0A9B0WTD1_CHRAS|nr:PREDICTED: uncharacterized protein C5orf52 homolog [Chrysochloris asiatica]
MAADAHRSKGGARLRGKQKLCSRSGVTPPQFTLLLAPAYYHYQGLERRRFAALQPIPFRSSRFHSNTLGRATAAAEGQSCHSAVSQAELKPRPVCTHHLAPIPKLYTSLEDSRRHSSRPSVTWNLNSPVANATSSQAATSFNSTPVTSALRRDSQDSRQDVWRGAQPQICFLRPRTSQPLVLFSLMNSSEAATTKFLPKSHLSRVIIRDNLCAQRIFEMEVKASDKTKKKMGHLYDHLKKKFMNDQLRKLGRWKRETSNLQQHLDNKIYLSAISHKASLTSCSLLLASFTHLSCPGFSPF